MLTEDRDRFMFENLRNFEEKVVAVVGLGHMDGIEILWKHAEESDNNQPPTMSENEGEQGYVSTLNRILILIDLFILSTYCCIHPFLDTRHGLTCLMSFRFMISFLCPSSYK